MVQTIQGFPIRNSRDQRVLAPTPSLSQLYTSFIGCWYQGIHRKLFVALPDAKSVNRWLLWVFHECFAKLLRVVQYPTSPIDCFAKSKIHHFSFYFTPFYAFYIGYLTCNNCFDNICYSLIYDN